MQALDWLSDSAALTPHGFCLLWEPELIWLDAAADIVTMLAYFSIPLAMLWFLRRRGPVPQKWLAILFVLFIVACGTGHGLSALTLWVPAYHVEGVVKGVTAGLSIVTAGVLWLMMPRLLTLPTAHEVTALNAELRATIFEQNETAVRLGESEQRLQLAHERLRQSNEALERRVAERTAELVAVHQAAARSAARFQSVVEAAPNAMVMVSGEGQIEMVNAATERVFGYERAELLGRPIEMLLPESIRGRHVRLRTDFLAAPTTRAMGAGSALSGRRKDGRTFEVEIGLNPIDVEGQLMVLSAITDISARTRLEGQLRQSQKMEAIGQVAAGVAHDFNNLLQALGGSLELLLETVGDRSGADLIHMALKAATRGSDLTNRLLAFSRQQILDARPVPVSELLEHLEKLIRHLFETRPSEKNEIVVEAGPAGLAALADTAQLEAALINLTLNARDAMPSGGCLRITARAAEAEPGVVAPGRYTIIAVSDTGCGMDAETVARACDPFFTTKGTDGTGLGLSMVQGFARQSGGEARILSRVGHGTTVELWLPSADAAPAVPVVPVVAASLQGHVLLVDDAQDVLLTFGSFLRKAGLTVTEAQSGDMAVAELLTGRRFDAIVTDLAMPGLNGLDLLQQAREIDPRVPGVLVTGFYSPELASTLSNVTILRKPLKRAELVAKVQEAIERARQNTPS